MEFYTVSNQKRPVRSCDETRQFAWDSLNHVYGLDTQKVPYVSMDDVDGFKEMSQLDKYDLMIRKIVNEAPIRVCKNEKVSGAATLGDAPMHMMPARYNKEYVLQGISHLTIDFECVLKRGINGIYQDVVDSQKVHSDKKQLRFLESCRSILDSMKIWHNRYLSYLENKPEYSDNYKNLCNVPFNPPSNFYEAVQSIWFTFAFVRLSGNWPGIGRIDYLLGDYLKKDLESGLLSIDEAREILAHFFIKGCEWIRGGEYGSGDAQHYQNIVLSGIDENGKDVTNEVTYLVLDIVEEFGISDFPITVRLNKNTDTKLLRRIAEVLRFGGGILAFYNEDLILEALTDFGYPASDAWKFANDGCWEIQIPGKTFFCYDPFDSLRILQNKTLKNYESDFDFDSFDDLYLQYANDLSDYVGLLAKDRKKGYENTDLPVSEWIRKDDIPCTVVSVFEEGCIKKAASYLENGPVYNVVSPHIGGLADTVNSLYAIKKIVFDEKLVSFKEFISILAADWEGYEELRQKALNGYMYYGNDNDEADEIAVRVLADFAKACKKYEPTIPYFFPAGVSTFGRQIEWAPYRMATPHGHRKGEVLASNCSPTPGSDIKGATAIIRSYCKADLKKMVTGAALDLKLLSSSVEGDDGIEAIMSLLSGFVSLGGIFIQPDVENKEILLDAQRHPENYQTLSVRISGWNARFVTLNNEWQDMIINESK